MKIRTLIILLTLFILAACGGKDGSSSPAPQKAQLVSPAKDEVCVIGTIISTTESGVSFSWTKAPNTDSYDLIIKNLLTADIIKKTTNATSFNVTLSRNTPYSWYVVSHSLGNPATAQSDTWKFYNAGPGVITYAPFPADIISPVMGADIDAPSGKINLTWKGSSVTPGANLTYDVYLSENNKAAVIYSAITDEFLDNITILSGAVYYWKVVTKDGTGNTSDTGYFVFYTK